MNWEVISAVGELVGAAAVVASLVYLAIQMRVQNAESRLAAMHGVVEAYRNTVSRLLEPDLARVFAKIMEGARFDELSLEERLRLSAYAMLALKLYEEAYYELRNDRLDSHLWEGMLAQLTDSLGIEAFGTIWKLRRHQFGAEFREFVDGLSGGTYPI